MVFHRKAILTALNHLVYCLILITLLWSADTLVAQPKFLYFNQINRSDGLPDLNNEWVFKDSRGFVWISTTRGLARYNGNKVDVYKHIDGDDTSLPDDIIQSSFFEDAEGNIWFSTYSALCCYIRKYDHFKRISLPSGLGENGFYIPFEDPERGLALLVDQKTLYYYDKKTGRFTAQHEVKDVLRMMPLYNSKGKLTGVFGFDYSNPGLRYYQYNQQNELIATRNLLSGDEARTITIYPNRLAAQSDTLVWIAASTGLFRFNPANGKLTPLPGSSKHGYFNVALWGDQFVLAMGIDGKLQVFNQLTGAPAGNIHLLNIQQGSYEGLKSQLYIDPDGAIWLSIFNLGLYVCQSDKVKFDQIMPTGADPKFQAIILSTDRRDQLWCVNKQDNLFATTMPVALNNKVKLQRQQWKGIRDEVFYFFIDSKGNKWALCFDGLYKAVNGSLDFRKIAGGYFLYGKELADGRVLFSKAKSGLWTWDGSHLIPKPLSASNLAEHIDSTLNFINFFEDQQGLVYACEDLKDLWVVSPRNDFEVLKIIPFRTLVHSFYQRPGEKKVWMGSNAGLSFIDTKTFEIQRLYKKDGVSASSVYALLGDSTGRLWFTTDKTLVCYDPQKKHSVSYDQSDGLLGMEFSPKAFIATAADQFWLGNQYGINGFNPYTLRPSPRKPRVALINLLVNDQNRKPICVVDSSTNIAQVRHIMLKPNERTISFDVALMDYGNPGADSFRYQMANYEHNWVTAPVGERIRYPNLPAGEYTLNVIGVNMQGVESDPISLKITVLKKLQEQWWFSLFIILLLGALLVFGVRYYYKQEIREVLLRNQISADLHDDIGASMSNIGILITLIRQRLGGNGETTALLDRVDEEVASSADALDDIIWSINPINDPLDRVLARMRRFATEVFEAKDINGVIQFPQNIQHLRLGLEKRRQFYLLFKEAVNNLAKYAQCTEASIVVEYHKGVLFLTITDNGVGFNVEESKEKGNGLKTMLDRAVKLNAAFTIESTPGHGTFIQVLLPITE